MTSPLPQDWQHSTLGAVCTKPQYGWTTKADREHGEVRLLRTTDITSGEIDWASVPFCTDVPADLEKYQLRPNDIVISRAGSVGASYLIRDTPGKSVFASYLIRFYPKESVEPKYVAYFLQTSEYWNSITERSVGIAVPNVNATKLETIQIPVAPLPQQKIIVGKVEELFSDLDAGVTALKRAQANLKRYRAAVLKAAVEGRLTEQWRAERKAKGVATEPAAQLLARILAERRRKWEAAQLKKYADAGKAPLKDWQNKYPEPTAPDTSRLHELPEGWCWANTEQLGEVQLGRQRSPKNRSKDFPTKYLRAANLTEAGLDLSDVLDMEFTPREKETFCLKLGDLILSEASGSPNQVGKPAVWRNELKECCFQNTVIRLRPAEGLSEFMLKIFQAFYVNGVFARTATGVGINHLSAYKFAKIAVPLGPLSEQIEIISQVEAKLSNIAQAETEIKRSLERAARLRQAILKRAFEGRLV